MTAPPTGCPTFSFTPIGLFDSGVGGLTVWREVARILPAYDLIYFADQKYCPYGARPREEIIARARHISEFLIAQGCQIIVVACNTASAAALSDLRETFPNVTFVGMEPAVKPAVQLTKTRVVGVLATEGTLRGELFEHTRDEFARGVRVVTRTAHGLVEQIERGEIDSPATHAIIGEAIGPMVAAGADVVALGCTHYPFVMPVIRDLFGDTLALIDPSDAVAKQTARILRARGGIRNGERTGQRVFYTSGDEEEFERVLEKLLGIHSAVKNSS